MASRIKPINLTLREGSVLRLKVYPETGAYQMLSQIATLVGIALGARIIELVVFDKGTKVGIEEVI